MMDETLLNRLVNEVVEEQKSSADLDGYSMTLFLYGFADKVLEEAAKVCEAIDDHGENYAAAALIEAAEAIRALTAEDSRQLDPTVLADYQAWAARSTKPP